MIDQGLFQKKIVGKDGFIWWIGQVASDSWQMNIVGSLPKGVSAKDQEGFDYRYQVRIMGYHTGSCEALSDNDLPWAAVMYPVTAGSNAGSAGATPNIRKGNFVYGFFLDGDDAQQPVIMGIVGYNRYTTIYKNTGECMPFVPFLGYSKTQVPDNSIRVTKEDSTYLATGARLGRTSATVSITQGPGGSSSQESAADAQSYKDGSRPLPLKSPYACGPNRSILGVQKQIINLIDRVETAKKTLTEWEEYATTKITDVQQYINNQLERASELISGIIADLIGGVQTWIVQKIEAAMKKLYIVLYPSMQQKAGDASKVAMDRLSCHFKKIINNLFKLVYQALTGILDKWINVPVCAAENVIAAIIGKIMGLINGIVNSIMGPLNAIFDAAGAALDIAGSVFKFLDGIISFLNCEISPECPTVDNWATWLGSKPESTVIDAGNLVKKIEEFAGTVSDVVDPDNFNFDTDLDLSNIADEAFDNCDTNPILCGPPRAVFWGGSGNDASGNVIVSAAGDILGVDIINTGSGYDDKAPFLTFEDDCGNGNGGFGTVVTGPVSPGDEGEWFSDPDGDEIGVVGVIIDESGFGYLPVADGSQGGDGRTWADSDQTTIRHIDNVWDSPYSPGEVVPANTGDVIRTPIGSRSEFNCMDGKTHEVLGGSDFIVPCDGVITAPPGEDTSIPGGQYPAILYICEVEIVNGGFDYQPGDKVVITPDVGAEITPTFGPFGNLIKLEIINGGEGFREFPTIEIESDTGFNAVIRARLCIDRITDELKLPDVQDKVVQVVDCVGKV